jgi:hypothetical protein
MSSAYQDIIASSEGDLRDIFNTAATRVGTTVQNIEKDFWVCWTLDALFHRLPTGGPRLLFKGGTSLSKGYGLISRFSEDIDITVFRSDLGTDADCDQLEALSKKQRAKHLDAIRDACQTYIGGKLRDELSTLAKETMETAGKDPANLSIVLDEDDAEGQTLLIHYPSAVEKSDYVNPSVKIESGAKSALDPNQAKIIIPYLAPDYLKEHALEIPNVTTIDPERTMLDKILILHGMTYYFEAKGALRGNGRMSRHYYDVHQLMNDVVGETACKDTNLIQDCVRHARMFFFRNNTGLDLAQQGSFRLSPTPGMLDPLQKDFTAMATMIFGDVPSFEAILESVARAEEMLNSV